MVWKYFEGCVTYFAQVAVKDVIEVPDGYDLITTGDMDGVVTEEFYKDKDKNISIQLTAFDGKFSDYYDVSDTTTYHLAQKLDTSDRFNINEVPESDLSKIYEELGKPYFDMDLLRLEKELD